VDAKPTSEQWKHVVPRENGPLKQQIDGCISEHHLRRKVAWYF
jgi:hypothetical protein